MLKLLCSIRAWRNAIRVRRAYHRAFADIEEKVRRLVYSDGQIVVRSGPFEGMKLADVRWWGCAVPCWLGVYEEELHDIIEQIVSNAYTDIIDVGCADGYYAVGLALRMPKSNVWAYDTDFAARMNTRKNQKLNKCGSNLYVDGKLNPKRPPPMGERVAVICDIEGGEYELLNPSSTNWLAKADILVELHSKGESITERIELMRGRFGSTHTIMQIVEQKRDIAKIARYLGINSCEDILAEAVNEHRSEQQFWLWMTSKTANDVN
jgi:precorrin-6B methylase 2